MIDSYFYKDIPTYKDGIWTTSDFSSRDDFRDFNVSIFKEPGQYQFNETSSKIFNEQAKLFNEKGSTINYLKAKLKKKPLN